MSRHHKRLTLSALNDTWDEIGIQSRKLEERINRTRTDAINTAIRVAKTEIDKAKAETKRCLEKEIKDLERRNNSRLAVLERRHNENLRRATDAIYDDMQRGFENMSRAIEAESEYLNGRIDNLQDWTQRNLDVISKNIRQIQQDTNKRFEQQQQQIDSLQDSLQGIFDRFKNEATMARDVVDDMINLLKAVCDNHPVNIYAPAELHEIRSHINDLMSRCGKDPAASVISESRGIIRDILKMKEKTLLEKAKHDEMLFQTKARLSAILDIIAKNIDQEIERDGDTATIATDFWTDDEYTKVQSRLKAIERQLANEEQNDQLTFDKIAELLKEIEHLNLEGIALMQKAVRKAIQSQDRAEITLDIVNTMIRQGYEIKVENGNDDFDYMGGQIESDQREGVFAILRHPNTGEEITIVLQPNLDEKSNDIAIHVDNPHQAITEQQLRQSIERIRQEMRKSGYDPGPITTPVNGGNEVIPQMQSGLQMRKRGAAGQLRGSL